MAGPPRLWLCAGPHWRDGGGQQPQQPLSVLSWVPHHFWKGEKLPPELWPGFVSHLILLPHHLWPCHPVAHLSLGTLFCPHLIFLFNRIPPAPGIRAPTLPPPSLSPEFNNLHPGKLLPRIVDGTGKGQVGPSQGIGAERETGNSSWCRVRKGSTPKHDYLIGTGDRGMFLACLVTRLLSALRSKIRRWPEEPCRLGPLCGWSLQHCAASRLQSTSKSLDVPSYFLSAALLSPWLPQACLCLFALPLLSSDMPLDGSPSEVYLSELR